LVTGTSTAEAISVSYSSSASSSVEPGTSISFVKLTHPANTNRPITMTATIANTIFLITLAMRRAVAQRWCAGAAPQPFL